MSTSLDSDDEWLYELNTRMSDEATQAAGVRLHAAEAAKQKAVAEAARAAERVQRRRELAQCTGPRRHQKCSRWEPWQIQVQQEQLQ